MSARPSVELDALTARVRPPAAADVRDVRARLDDLTKPPGSLGRLEDTACRIARILGDPPPELRPRAVIVLAGDHGVVTHGVSAYPATVTGQMCRNIGSGGAAVSVLARRAEASLIVTDIGVLEPVEHPAVLDRNVVRGTADLASVPALTPEQARRAVLAGADLVRETAPDARLLALGEMGIGNTTSAAAVTAALLGLEARDVVGPGTGIDEEGLERKCEVVARGLARIPESADPLRVLSEVGGAEIAGLVGVVLEGAGRSVPVLLDGFITTAAALVAVRLVPQVADYLFASHRSAEPGHALQLDALWLEPLLDLDLRLGEGSGAALAIPLMDAASAVLREMATFSSAGISGPGRG